MTTRIIFALLRIVLFIGFVNVHAESVQVDDRIVLEIGEHKISCYIVEKYFKRFVEAERQHLGHAPGEPALRNWFELFLAQQVLIAHAEEKGYGNRPEVRTIVDRMERYMMSQPDGPFYRILFRPPVLGEAALRRLYQQTCAYRDVVLVRFPNEAVADRLLGRDFRDQIPAEKIRRLQRCRAASDATSYEGRLSWPFEPFVEAADWLVETSADSWIDRYDSDFGVYRGYMGEMTTLSGPRFEEERERLSALAARVATLAFHLRHRARELSGARFRLSVQVATQLGTLLTTLPRDASAIPENFAAELNEKTLFSYQRDGAERAVTWREFREHFNAMFIRRMPISPNIVRSEAESMAVEDLDVQAARAAHVDEAAQFVADRRGFHTMQVLDLYEKEVMRPQITVETDEIENIYWRNLDSFRRVARVRGRRLRFYDLDQFLGWQRGATQPNISETLVVTRRELPPSFDVPVDQVMLAPPGATFGPINDGNGFQVFVKDGDIDMETIPLAEAAPRISTDLFQRKLAFQELKRAHKLSTGIRIVDRIEYAKYGVDQRQLKTPWTAYAGDSECQ